MRIDKKSLMKLIGKSREVVVYGLLDCLYRDVVAHLDSLGELNVYDVMTYDDDGCRIPVIEIDMGADTRGDMVKRCSKAGITSVLIENYKRSQRGEPLVPLIFCIELQADHQQVVLNTERVAKLTGHDSSVTDAELRRCFKSYREASPELRDIVERTFKFVRVRQDDQEKDLYHLQELTPFWKRPDWNQLWKERNAQKNKKVLNKKFPWRKVVAEKIRLFHAEPEFDELDAVQAKPVPKWYEKYPVRK